MMLRFNTGLRSVAGHPAYGKQLGIAARFVQPREDGLPDRAEQKSLDKIKEKIMRTFQGGNVHLYAGVITTKGCGSLPSTRRIPGMRRQRLRK